MCIRLMSVRLFVTQCRGLIVPEFCEIQHWNTLQKLVGLYFLEKWPSGS